MKGIREDAHGLQAYVRVQGRLYAKRYPKGTAASILKDWREAKRVAVKTGADIPTVTTGAPTFAQDVRTYWMIKGPMATVDRTLHLEDWARVFHGRSRDTITAPMIRAQLERWRTERDYANSTLNHRRTALMDLWTVLDGKSAANPVRDVPKYPEDDEGPIRALSHRLIYRILACMAPSKTRARLRVMAWTGWPQKQLQQLEPAHLQLDRARAYVTPRRKGKGTRGHWLPLLPPAVTALRIFDRWDCYGPFSNASMRQAFLRALAKLNAHRAQFGRRPIRARPYDLRHSFGVLVAALVKDDAVVQALMLHSEIEQTQRYIRAARTYRIDTAVAMATSEGFSGVLTALRGIGETGAKVRK